MGIFKDTMAELNVSQQQVENSKELQNFILSVIKRKSSGNWYQYMNGNGFCEINKQNGTLITTILTDDDFHPEFPCNIDCNLSNRCNNACSFCYLGCTPEGQDANLIKLLNDTNSFLYSLHEGTELALNGNEPLHPDLDKLLKFCKDRGILANLTVQENTLIKHKDQLENWLNNGLIHGIGISPAIYSDEMIEFCKKYPTAVIHTIAGITTQEQYESLMDKNLKVLILGYKTFGKGITYKEHFEKQVSNKIAWLKDSIKDFINHFKVVSFDNLAIEQLNPRSFLTDEEYAKFFRGEDGGHTMYIDLVDETFAKNSIQQKENHMPLMNDVRDMLAEIHKRG